MGFDIHRRPTVCPAPCDAIVCTQLAVHLLPVAWVSGLMRADGVTELG